MGSPFQDLRKQASFFLREKMKNARLALTNATPAQILIEEALNGESMALEGPALRLISRAAFEVDDYDRIVDVLHKRLCKFDRKNWRASYKALLLLEHLLTHGPERVAEEFHSDADAISKMEGFQYVDEKGFNWGLSMKNKCERIQKLLEDKPFLREERMKARKVTRAITGIESSNKPTSAMDGNLNESSTNQAFRRFNSHYNSYENRYNIDDNGDSNGALLQDGDVTCQDRESLNGKTANVKPSPRFGVVGEEDPPEVHHPFSENEQQNKASLLSSSI